MERDFKVRKQSAGVIIGASAIGALGIIALALGTSHTGKDRDTKAHSPISRDADVEPDLLLPRLLEGGLSEDKSRRAAPKTSAGVGLDSSIPAASVELSAAVALDRFWEHLSRRADSEGGDELDSFLELEVVSSVHLPSGLYPHEFFLINQIKDAVGGRLFAGEDLFSSTLRSIVKISHQEETSEDIALKTVELASSSLIGTENSHSLSHRLNSLKFRAVAILFPEIIGSDKGKEKLLELFDWESSPTIAAASHQSTYLILIRSALENLGFLRRTIQSEQHESPMDGPLDFGPIARRILSGFSSSDSMPSTLIANSFPRGELHPIHSSTGEITLRTEGVVALLGWLRAARTLSDLAPEIRPTVSRLFLEIPCEYFAPEIDARNDVGDFETSLTIYDLLLAEFFRGADPSLTADIRTRLEAHHFGLAGTISEYDRLARRSGNVSLSDFVERLKEASDYNSVGRIAHELCEITPEVFERDSKVAETLFIELYNHRFVTEVSQAAALVKLSEISPQRAVSLSFTELNVTESPIVQHVMLLVIASDQDLDFDDIESLMNYLDRWTLAQDLANRSKDELADLQVGQENSKAQLLSFANLSFNAGGIRVQSHCYRLAFAILSGFMANNDNSTPDQEKCLNVLRRCSDFYAGEGILTVDILTVLDPPTTTGSDMNDPNSQSVTPSIAHALQSARRISDRDEYEEEISALVEERLLRDAIDETSSMKRYFVNSSVATAAQDLYLRAFKVLSLRLAKLGKS